MVASAATLQLLHSTSTIHVGDTFAVGVDLNTGQDSINAIEGAVTFSPELSLQDVRLTGSLVSLWVTQPALQGSGAVTFAGLIPSGYQGSGLLSQAADNYGDVYTLIFKAVSVGTAQISFDPQTAVYKNDGKGTPAVLTAKNVSITIAPSQGTPHDFTLTKDTTPPESFVPRIVSGESFGYQGNALVFVATDKDSGVDYYEFARSYWGTAREDSLTWYKVVSPHFLTASDESQYLYVRAVDKAGNTRVAVVTPQNGVLSVLADSWWMIAVLLVLLVLIVWWLKRRRS